MTDPKKTCFVIAPVGSTHSDIRKRADQLVSYVLEPVLSKTYTITRADKIGKPGIITTQIIDRVVNDDLVVADLTGRNPNVFYELAVRHALKKPLIQIMASGEDIPFDVAGMRTVIFDIHDLDSVEEAKREIAEQAASMENGTGTIDTPISVALDTQELRGSDNPIEKSLGDILDAVAALRDELRSQKLPYYTTAAVYPATTIYPTTEALSGGTILTGVTGYSGVPTPTNFTIQFPPEDELRRQEMHRDMRREEAEYDAMLDAAAEAAEAEADDEAEADPDTPASERA
jgi:hypothetical protein